MVERRRAGTKKGSVAELSRLAVLTRTWQV